MPDNRKPSAPVPASRSKRLLRIGTLASRVAGNVVAQGSRQWLQGQRPKIADLLLTPQNVNKVTEQLANMRGAAMKVGQLVSMDAGTLLPAELADILARLQDDALHMPAAQWSTILENAWGADWQADFQHFSFTPVAAASIGQVHEATDRAGRHMAIKIQYPGIARSIDSDVDNVVSLLRLTGLIPKGLDLAPLIAEARRQLHIEADYRQEGQHLQDYADKVSQLDDHTQFVLPHWYAERSHPHILCMSFVHGEPLSQIPSASPQADRLVSGLIRLFLAELLQFHAVQTDPNLANYRYQPDSQRLVLLDFGALRYFSREFVQHYQRVLRAATTQARDALQAALTDLGFFRQGIDVANRDTIIDIFIQAAEPLRHRGPYDFGRSDLAERIHAKAMKLSRQPDAWHTPPVDVLFLHRKMVGLYLLARRLGARVDAHALFNQALEDYADEP